MPLARQFPRGIRAFTGGCFIRCNAAWHSRGLLVDSLRCLSSTLMPTDQERSTDRVLIVEDEENARRGYEALLRKWGLDVLGVPSAEDALARFSEYNPAVVIADVE